MVLYDGRWIGPRTSSGGIDDSIITDIIETRPGYARPSYLRFTNVSSGEKAVPKAGSDELALAKKLVAAGIRLGVCITALHGGHDDSGTCLPAKGKHAASNKCILRAADVIEHAAQARRASEAAGGIYDWIFLDFAWTRTPAGSYGLNDLQQIVDGMAGAGWDQIMINGTGFGPKNFADIPQRVWSVARHFQIFESPTWQSDISQVVQGHGDALTSVDDQFVSYVQRNRKDTRAVLKLEVPTNAQQFRTLSHTTQLALLADWAEDSARIGATMIYPLYIDGTKPISNQANQYDSVTADTFWQQRALMARYG